MGNCLSCFKAPPVSGAAGPPTSSQLAIDDKHVEEMAELLPYQTTLLDRDATQLVGKYEVHINGNTTKSLPLTSAPVKTIGSDNCGSLNRIQNEKPLCKTFYQRIPSLPRSVSTMGSEQSKVSDYKLVALFEQYKDPNEDTILSDGIERLCNDLQMSPDEFRVLILAWKLNAEQMCRFTKHEFIQGLKELRADSIKSIQTRLPEIVLELQKDPELFKDLYRFTFKFGLDVASGQRILPVDMAVVLWKLVFTICEPPILNRWLHYLESHPHVRGVPKDTWYMFLNFADTVSNDLSCYDDTEAWPSLFDDFVEFENDQMNQNISKSDVIKTVD